jgi:hypothetical protein
MFHNNPYNATLQSETQSAGGRVVIALWWWVYLHPAITLTLIYSCWMLTTVSLGRPPGFGEHPSNDPAHTVVHALGISAALSTLVGPLLIPIGLLWGLVHPFAQRPPDGPTITKRIACLTTYVVILAIVAYIYSSDPFGAVYWFWD